MGLGRRQQTGLPDDYERFAATILPAWGRLDADERDRLAELTDRLLRHKKWEAAAGFDLTEEMRVAIATFAGLVILGLDFDWYRDVQAIVVHPSTITLNHARPGPVPGVMTDALLPISGQASDRRGPVLIAWDAVVRDIRFPGRGENVVVHEFAHKLDMLGDGFADGTPPLPDGAARARWQAVCTPEYDALRLGFSDAPLRDYGATNPAEFFAVASEAFFDRPEGLAASRPALYGVLRDFYRQDPLN